jgi:hypothetical protein
MSFEPVMPPFNSSDPSANFLSSSCLDFLLIELVPMAYRVTHERDSITSESNGAPTDTASTSHAVSSSAAGIMAGTATRKDEEEDMDAVHYRLEMLGYRVGQGLVERCASIFGVHYTVMTYTITDSRETDHDSTIHSTSSNSSAKIFGRWYLARILTT